MNTQKKTQDEKARKRLMEVARSGKSLMPRMGGGGPLMPATPNDMSADEQERARFFAPDPNMYRNDAKNMANVKDYIEEQGGQVAGPRGAPTAASVLDKFQTSQFAAQQPQDPMQQPLTMGGMQSLLGLGTETKKPSAQGYNPGLNLNGSMDKERVGGFGQYTNPPSATLTGYAGGGRISGWNVDRAAQLAAAENAAMGQQASAVSQQVIAPAQGGGMELSEGERMALEENRAREAAEVAAQKPVWKQMLGMARGGPLMPPVWDGRQGGEVPPGPEGVDTVPAVTQAGPVMLDSQIGEGRQEYVLTPEMVEALGGAGELDVLRQALGQGQVCGEGMACGGGRGVPKMAEGGKRVVNRPYGQNYPELDLYPAGQQARMLAEQDVGLPGLSEPIRHGPLVRGAADLLAARDYRNRQEGGSKFGPAPAAGPPPVQVVPSKAPPTLETRKLMPGGPSRQMGAEQAATRVEDTPQFFGRYGKTDVYKNTVAPEQQAEYGQAIFSDTAEGATRAGLDRAIAEKGQTIPWNAMSPRMLAGKAEADANLARQWYSLKSAGGQGDFGGSERGRMPDYVAEALGKPYARPQTQDQVWAAAQRQQVAAQTQAEQAQQAKIKEEIVKGEYGVKAAQAKAQDEASKYKITEQQNEWDPAGPPITKVERQGRGEPPTLMPQKLPGSGLPPKVLNTIPRLKEQSPERRKAAINLMLNDFKDNPEQLTILQQLLKESGLLE